MLLMCANLRREACARQPFGHVYPFAQGPLSLTRVSKSFLGLLPWLPIVRRSLRKTLRSSSVSPTPFPLPPVVDRNSFLTQLEASPSLHASLAPRLHDVTFASEHAHAAFAPSVSCILTGILCELHTLSRSGLALAMLSTGMSSCRKASGITAEAHSMYDSVERDSKVQSQGAPCYRTRDGSTG